MSAALDLQAAAWDEALAGLPGGDDVYFGHGYHLLHAGPEVNPECVMVEEDGRRLVVPGLRRPVPGHVALGDLQTCNGYGGPLASADLDPERCDRLWRRYREAAAADSLVAAFFRLHPLLGNERWLPSDARVVEDRQTVLVDLAQGLEPAWWAADSRFRNKVTRARRDGLAVRWDQAEDWPAFESLYADAMERLRAVETLRFQPVYFERLRQLPAAHLGTVRDGAGLLAGVVFLEGPRWSHYHLGARRADAQNHVMTFLVHAAMARAASARLAAVHLGGGATCAPDDSLLRWKRRFSATRLSFKVGLVVVNPDAFARLTWAWEAQTGRPPRWLLGYRQPVGP